MLLLPGCLPQLVQIALSCLFSAKTPVTQKSSAAPSSGKAGLEMGIRMGGMGGELVDQEEWYYERSATEIRDGNGKWAPVRPSVRGVGLEINGWLLHSPVVQVGIGLEMEWYRIHPLNYNDDVYARDFLNQQNFLMKIRVLPFVFSGVRLGLEAGAGLAMGTVRRYALALIDRPDLYNGAVHRGYYAYTYDGNRPINLLGTRMGFGPVLFMPLGKRLGLVAKGDFHWTAWNLEQDDPLKRYSTPAYPGYPRGLVAQGADFALLLAATF